MATELKMPQLSDTMQSGKILSWYKNEGDSVKRGEAIAEVETEKANLEIECFQQGVILRILVPAGSSATVGSVIAIIGEVGELVETTPSAASPAIDAQATVDNTPQAIEALPESTGQSSMERIKASPLARKVAEDMHIDLSSVSGTGPGGRILRRDVESLPAVSQTTPRPQAAPQFQKASVTAGTPNTVQTGHSTALTKMRETIARRMQESVREAPHFYVTVSVKMDELLKLREALKEDSELAGISINHFVIKACAYALSKVPAVNSSIRDGQLYEPSNINIGIVTSVEDGLLIPVIKDADLLPLKDIVFEAKAAVDRAKAGRPNSADLSGGTFSISNMGMMDVENFTAIINPGQGAILAVSSIRKEAIIEDDSVKVAHMMKVTLSSDHRVIDGVSAARFLRAFKNALQSPALMFI